MNKWYSNLYRRHLLDMHIEDWNKEFLSEFSVEDYYNNLVKAHIQAAMIYLQSHTGLCNFPTDSAKMHSALTGKEDLFKRLIDKCRSNGIKVTGYYSLIFNVWAEKNHPDWAIRYSNGKTWQQEKGVRYGLCCPNNSEYRLFLKEQIKEIAHFFKLDGIFFDMPYWEVVCHCDSCKKRWKEETGLEDIPSEINWKDEKWLKLVRKRQQWMEDFSKYVTSITREIMPEVTVEQNFAAAVNCDWLAGSTEGINEACEFTGGDLYGDLYNHSFTCKYYMGITNNKPFEYMTCRCNASLREHTITKTEEMLTSEILLTAAYHGASLVIDAIDPKGTVDGRVYDLIGKVFEKQMPYEEYFTGEYLSDIAAFFDSRTQFKSNNIKYGNKDCVININRTCIENHLLLSIVANGHLDNINRYKMVFAPALEDFQNENILKLISYVKEGGILYISGASDKRLITGLLDAQFLGMTGEDSKYPEIFKGYDEVKTYINPKKEYEALFAGFTADYPVPVSYNLPKIKLNGDGVIMATISLPYTDPNDYNNYASIHSNPTGKTTDYPAMIIKNYGKGKVIWSAAMIEADSRINFRNIFINIVRLFINEKDLAINAKLSKNVETVVFKKEDTYYLSLIDLLSGEEVFRHNYEIRLNAKKDGKVYLLPEQKEIRHKFADGGIVIEGNLKKFAMIKFVINK